jgi:hypothetical protein
LAVSLRFGFGIVLLPFGLAISTEYLGAARCAVRLSDVVADVVQPFGPTRLEDELARTVEEQPTPAVYVPDDIEPEPLAKPPTGHNKRGKAAASNQPNPKALPAIYVNAETVLRIANSGQRPSGKPVTAAGQRPAGVQVFGASSLGVGVRDGDIITRVSGVPVRSSNQVIALVIAARGARQPAIGAELYRGQRSYTLTVEQPYPNGADPPANVDAGSSAADRAQPAPR